MGRVLIVRHAIKNDARKIARLNETVVRQPPRHRIAHERVLERIEMLRQLAQNVGQRRSQRHVVKIDAPASLALRQTVEDRRHEVRKAQRRIVHVAGRGPGMDEETVWPSLVRRRCVPTITHPKDLASWLITGTWSGVKPCITPRGSFVAVLM